MILTPPAATILSPRHAVRVGFMGLRGVALAVGFAGLATAWLALSVGILATQAALCAENPTARKGWSGVLPGDGSPRFTLLAGDNASRGAVTTAEDASMAGERDCATPQANPERQTAPGTLSIRFDPFWGPVVTVRARGPFRLWTSPDLRRWFVVAEVLHRPTGAPVEFVSGGDAMERVGFWRVEEI